MKFFYKMFLGMTVILAVALGMIEYVTYHIHWSMQ